MSTTADGAATTRSIRFCDLTHDDAGLGADEIATGLRQVRMLNDGHDTFEPIHRDPGRDVVPKEQAQRLLHIFSFLAVCLPLYGLAAWLKSRYTRNLSES